MKNADSGLAGTERSESSGKDAGRGGNKIRRTKKGRRKKKSKWESILVEIRVILALFLIFGGIDAKLHPGDRSRILTRLVLSFYHLFAVLFNKVFKLDKDSADVWGGIIGLAVLFNLVLFILGGVEELKKDWGYFFSKRIREKVRKEARKDKGTLVYQIIISSFLIFFTIIFPLYLFVVALATHNLDF